MIVKRFYNSILASNSYLIHNSNKAILIDIGDVADLLVYIKDNQLTISSVLITHAHFDHIYGLNRLFNYFSSIPLYTNQFGKEMLVNAKRNMSLYHGTPFVFDYYSKINTISNGEFITFAENLSAHAVFTPGHNPSCITWVIENMIFTGDSYIPGVKTVTNLPGGNKRQSEESLELIKKLALGRTIYPGHSI